MCCGRGREPTCASLSEARAWSDAAPVCRAEYTHTRAADDGIRLALALTYSGHADEGAELAASLVDASHGALGADAAYLAGRAALARGEHRAAATLLSRAIEGHQGDPSKIARDAQQLAGVHEACGEFQRGLDVATEALRALESKPEPRMTIYLEIARSDLLRRLGDDVGAQLALDRAAPLLETDDDRSWWELKRGIVDLDAERFVSADTRLRALRERAISPQIRGAVDVNLAWLADHAGRGADAEALLREALEAGIKPLDVAYARAGMARRRGDPAAAAQLLAPFANAPLEDEWQWDIPLELARIERARGHRAAAEADYRRAMAAITARQRNDGRRIPSTNQRRVYDELFDLLAEQTRWHEALAVLVELDRTRLSDLAGEANETAGRWGRSGALPQPCAPGLADEGSARDARDVVDDIARAATTNELVVLVMTQTAVWRIRFERGVPRGDRAATHALAHALISRVVAEPGDEDAQRQLGNLLLPVSTSESDLFVASFGEVARLALPALRPGGTALIDRRPVVRAVPFDVATAPSAVRAPPVVLGDPGGDLAAARDEARWVGLRLGSAPRLGDAANRHALFATSPSVVHIAAHATMHERQVVLPLADAMVAATEVDDHDWSATRLVALATCGSAASIEVEGRGSLAHAFLRGRARAVLATLWSVEDARAQRLVRAFYEADGVGHPALALATAQRHLRTTMPTRQWAAFAILAPLPLTGPRSVIRR